MLAATAHRRHIHALILLEIVDNVFQATLQVRHLTVGLLEFVFHGGGHVVADGFCFYACLIDHLVHFVDLVHLVFELALHVSGLEVEFALLGF